MRRNTRTLRWCPECFERVLRSERFEHPHDVGFPDWDEDDENESSDESEDADEDGEEAWEVGGKYRVTIYYQAVVEKTVVAYSESEAKDIVEYDYDTTDVRITDKVHDEVRELKKVYSDDPEAEEHDLI